MSFNYPIGKVVPPPSGGGGGGAPNWGPPGGAQGGWAPPPNAYGGSGGWSQPTGAWSAPTGAWAVGGGGGGGYPPSGPVHPPPGHGSYPPPMPPSGYAPGPPPSQQCQGGLCFPSGMPSGYPSGSQYPSGPSYPSGAYKFQPGGNAYPSQPSNFHSGSGYSHFPGGGQPYAPPVIPQVASTVTSGGDVGAIEYFKAMSDQDVIPDEGRAHFLTLAGVDGAVDAYELEDILNKVFLSEFKFNGFSPDMTRSLVAMRDYDISGKLGFEDFRKLWTDLAWCKRTFVMFDVNKSGAFCKNEFSKALETIGITVTPRVHQALIMRYADKEGTVRFDDFVLCYIRLKTMMTTYQGKDPQNAGISEFDRDELAIYS